MIPKDPFYQQGWFILIMFILAPFTFFITGIIGAILLLIPKDDSYKYYYNQMMMQPNNIIQQARQQADYIVNQANQEYSRIVSIANQEQAKINRERQQLEREKARVNTAKTLSQSEKEKIKQQQLEEKEIESEIKQAEKIIADAEKEIEKLRKSNSLEQIAKRKLDIEQANVDIDYLSELLYNQTAGYVYVLSNIGSFGVGIYKIGFTKNPEPLKVITELDTSSVPFPYDVHAIIYNDDAEELYEAIRDYFGDKMVNKVNTEKDFLRMDLHELRDFIYNNFDDSVVFNENVEAEQYYESNNL